MNRQASPGPILRDVVLLGAGHAHVAVLRSFGMRPLPGVRLTLVTPQPEAAYSGMLPGVVAGLYRPDQARIELAPLARFAGARLYLSAATGLDLARRLVRCDGRPPVPYDLLSLDVGAAPDAAGVPGALQHATPVKPLSGLLDRVDALLERVRSRGGTARIAVVGGGAGGTELAFALAHRLGAATPSAPGRAALVLVASGGLLPGFPAAMRRRVAARAARHGITLRAGRVAGVEPGRLLLEDGGAVEADEIVWATQAGAPAWLRDTALVLDPRGFVAVDPWLRAIGRDDVFAAGDVAAHPAPPSHGVPAALPKNGVYAVRAGPVLARNLRAALLGRPQHRFRPQRHALALLSLGGPHAIGARNGVTLEGDWLWRWKDRLDRGFVRRFTELPGMDPAPPAQPGLAAAGQDAAPDPMRCGGCAAKIPADVLSRALGRLRPFPRAEVIAGLDPPDDAALVDCGGPRLLVHSVDQFRAIVDDPYLFGRIAAAHALSDLFAMGAEPQTALALATLPFGPPARIEAELSQLMQGANEVLAAAGCALVGGHTAEGAELSLGFAVNGLADRATPVLRKAGLRPGDALVLTRALGTGVLLAADMRGLARGRHVAAAVTQMQRTNRSAAHVLRDHGARAATDVTGFGLAGHLLEMLRAGSVDATLWPARLPLLDGALEAARSGIASSLQDANERAAPVHGAAGPRRTLLFDPQTSGGLLAGIAPDRAEACVAALHAAGDGRAAIIGRVEARAGSEATIRLEA